MMHNTCKDQLRRSEEQQQLEVQERQKAELICRNLELDMRTLANNIKQVAPLRTKTPFFCFFMSMVFKMNVSSPTSCNIAVNFSLLCLCFHWQLEEDLSETQRLLVQERSARTLQENLFNSHLRKQQEMEEENKRSVSMSNEVKLASRLALPGVM